MAFDHAALRNLEEAISADGGVPVAELRLKLKELFHDTRSQKDLDDYRLTKRHWKKLKEEVSPTVDFLHYLEFAGRVRFPLNNSVPDAWAIPNQGNELGIEVTNAGGRKRNMLALELVAQGVGRGFLPVTDNAPKGEFDSVLKRDRTMYTSRQALEVMAKDVEALLTKKSNDKYAGMWLLIVANLTSLPRARWTEIVAELRDRAATTPFLQVHIFSEKGEDPWGFRLK